MKANVGDLVRVATQPSNQWAGIVDYVAIVEEVKGVWANIISINLDGSGSGGGTVPLSCLVQEDSPEWVEALAYYRAKQAKLQLEAQERQTRWIKHLEEYANKHGVTPATALEIMRELERFR